MIRTDFENQGKEHNINGHKKLIGIIKNKFKL